MAGAAVEQMFFPINQKTCNISLKLFRRKKSLVQQYNLRCKRTINFEIASFIVEGSYLCCWFAVNPSRIMQILSAPDVDRTLKKISIISRFISFEYTVANSDGIYLFCLILNLHISCLIKRFISGFPFSLIIFSIMKHFSKFSVSILVGDKNINTKTQFAIFYEQ